MRARDWPMLRRRAAFVAAAMLTLAAGDCPSRSDRERYQASLDAPEAAAEAEIDTPLADPATGDILILGGGLSGYATAKTSEVEFFDASKRSFARSGKVATNRLVREAVVLEDGSLDGQALLAGGLAGEATEKKADLILKAKALNSAEAFNPDKGKTAKLPAKLNAARVGHTETLLADGRVLFVGGFDGAAKPLRSIEIFDPATRTFSAGGSLFLPRALHSATLLNDGRVLIAGGLTNDFGDTVSSAEIYDPAAGATGFAASQMQRPGGVAKLAGHTATLIAGCGCADDGKVLITGGFESIRFSTRALETATNVAMLFDPATNAFSATGVPQMKDERMLQSATALPGGRILIAGGIYGQGMFAKKTISGVYGGVLASAEIYDPAAKTMACVDGVKSGRCADAMANSRVVHGAALIGSGPLSGRVLLVGGAGATGRTTAGRGAPLKSAEIYDPKSNSFKSAGSMKTPRIFPAIAVVP